MTEGRSELPARHTIAVPDAPRQQGPGDSVQASPLSAPSPLALSPREHSSGARAENSELERRLLALERILQALVAHMAEAEPKFLARLTETFCVRMQMARAEHDYTDTDSYAAEFVRSVVRVGEKAARKPPKVAEVRKWDKRASFPGPGQAQSLFALPCIQVRQVGGVWHVTRDGRFYGDFVKEEEALQAVEAAGGAVFRAP